MPLRSQPYDIQSDQTMTPRAQEQERPHEIGLGIHKRKSDWGKSLGIEPTENSVRPEEAQRSHAWLLFMIASIVVSLLVFMMIPVIDNFLVKEGSNNSVENVKQFISFTSPIVIIITALAGTAGYFLLKRAAWLTVLGLFLGIALFAISIKTSLWNLNLGIYWILVGSFLGVSCGSLWEFISITKQKIHRELAPLFAIGTLASLVGLFFLIQANLPKPQSTETLAGAATQVSFTLFQPTYLPEKLQGITPKVYVSDNQVNMYYGNDHYPPPPIIDFLTGIEFNQSLRITGLDIATDPEPGSVYVDIGSYKGKYSERTGRSTLEWDQGDTHVVLNVYSNIPAREVFMIARTIAEVK